MSWSVISSFKHSYTSKSDIGWPISDDIIESGPLELLPIKVENSSFTDLKSKSFDNDQLEANYQPHMLFTSYECVPIINIDPFPARNTKIYVMQPDGSCFATMSFRTWNGYSKLDDDHFIMESSDCGLIDSPVIFLFRYIGTKLCLLSVEIWLPYETPKLTNWTVDENHSNSSGLREKWRKGLHLMVVKDESKKATCILRDDCKPIFVWDKSLCSIIIILREYPEFYCEYVLDKSKNMDSKGWALHSMCDCYNKSCDKFCQFELCHYDHNRHHVTKFFIRKDINGNTKLLSIEVFEP